MRATGKRDKDLKTNKERILVVDDEKMIRWSLGEALRGWGFVPIEAATAGDGIVAFEAESPAAVLLDINLPDGSGLDVLRKLRQREPDAVIIMITANVLVDETIAALRGGAYDFIGKPINLEEARAMGLVVPSEIKLPANVKLYALHAADGTTLGITDNWAAAYSAAVQNNFVPLSVH